MSDSAGRWRTGLDVFATIAMIAASIVIVVAFSGRSTDPPPLEGRRSPPASSPLPLAPIAVGETVLVGDDKARIGMLVYSDFQCPFCAQFAVETMPELQRLYVQTGKIRFGLRHLPLQRTHPRAFRAAEAAECAGAEGKFWPMHDVLFENPRSLEEQDLSEFSARIGLTPGKFKDCMREGQGQKIRQDITSARNIGVTGTPTILIGVFQPNGGLLLRERIAGARPLTDFQRILDKLLGGS